MWRLSEWGFVLLSVTCLLLLGAVAVFAATPKGARPDSHVSAHVLPGTIVVPAAAFFDQIPAGDSMDGRFPAGSWFFNNDTINLGTKTEVVAKVRVEEAGTYRLFVRSLGTETSSFKVMLDGQTDAGKFGTGKVTFVQGGTYELKAGMVEVRLTAIVPRPSLDVLVLTKRADFKEADLKTLELPDEVELLKEYTIPDANIVKFGDVEGHGRAGVLAITSDYSAYMYANDGHELWHWKAPAENARLRGEFEAPASIWDFDQDGKAEVVHWRLIDGKEWLVMADGMTGEVKKKAPWPTAPPLPHVYNNYRTAIAKFHKGYADNLLVLSDTGGTISLTAYDKDLNVVWQHVEARKKDYFGHYIYPVDVDGDGIDEVVISHLCLDAQGKVVWSNAKYFEDNHDHMDAMEFVDLDGDGKKELLVGQSDVGTLAYNAQNGDILWHNLSDHTQQITAGYILKDVKTPQVVVNARTYRTSPPRPPRGPGAPGAGAPQTVGVGQNVTAAMNEGLGGGGGLGAQLYWFDKDGNEMSRWPLNPLNGNPNFVRGDWYGDGGKEFFWYRFKLNEDGKATLFFKEPVYHMFDFMGNGAEQVITQERTVVRVYGYKGVKSKVVKRDSEYVRNSVANHTHY